MKSKESASDFDRRGFLRTLGGGATGTAAAVAGITTAPDAAAASESKADRVKKRYRESDHVKAYYRTNRY